MKIINLKIAVEDDEVENILFEIIDATMGMDYIAHFGAWESDPTPEECEEVNDLINDVDRE